MAAGSRALSAEARGLACSVLAELRARGVADVCIVCCDGLTGLPDAIGAVWPQAVVQLCVVHYADLRIMPTLTLDPLQGRGCGLARSA